MKHIEFQMLSGNSLSHYCRQNVPQKEVAIHSWTIENLCLDFIIPRKIKTNIVEGIVLSWQATDETITRVSSAGIAKWCNFFTKSVHRMWRLLPSRLFNLHFEMVSPYEKLVSVQLLVFVYYSFPGFQ